MSGNRCKRTLINIPLENLEDSRREDSQRILTGNVTGLLDVVQLL